MEKIINIHEDPDNWKRDITLLCCVLRLRFQPTVPYTAIADVILELFSYLVDELGKRVGPINGLEPEQGRMKPWLVEYLQQAFEYTEHWETEPWVVVTQGWSMDMAMQVLKLTQLDRKGFSVVEDDEMRLQIKWRREGSWKAGSIPLGKTASDGVLRAAPAACYQGSHCG